MSTEETVAARLEITCPSWCRRTAQEHADEIWNAGGDCHHYGPEIVVTDPTGYVVALKEPRYHDPIRVSIVATTNPEGRATRSPIVYLNDREHSIEQALALAAAIERTVEMYQGGVPA